MNRPLTVEQFAAELWSLAKLAAESSDRYHKKLMRFSEGNPQLYAILHKIDEYTHCAQGVLLSDEDDYDGFVSELRSLL